MIQWKDKEFLKANVTEFLQVNGKKVKCMGMELAKTNMVMSTKENGFKMNVQVRGISVGLKKIHIVDYGMKIKEMEKEFLNHKKEISIMVIGKMI